MIYKIQNIHVEKKIYNLIEGQMRISNGKQGQYKIPSGGGGRLSSLFWEEYQGVKRERKYHGCEEK